MTQDEIEKTLQIHQQQIVSLQADAMASQMVLAFAINAMKDVIAPEKLTLVFDRAEEIATVMAMRPENKTQSATLALAKISAMRQSSGH